MRRSDPDGGQTGTCEVLRLRQSRDKSRLMLVCRCDGDGEIIFSLREGTYRQLGSPLPGDTLTPEQQACAMAEDEEYRAMRRALYLLSFTDNNERTLIRKLCHSGFSREVAERVTQQAVRLGYINEERQLERLITEEANIRLSGPRKLIPKLAARGYRTEQIRQVLSRLTADGTVDLRRNAQRLLEKRLPQGADAEEKKKILYRYGYSIC